MMRSGGRSRVLRGCALSCSSVIALLAGAASAQEADEPVDKPGDIVVIGTRGSAVTDIAPIATLDAETIAGTGATTTTELLRSIQGVTKAADGSDPIFLLNAQRVSGYQEIGALPPEAIEKVEVLPEQAALRFGFPPTRRVVNFITKRNFRQIEAKASAGTTTRLGSATEKGDFGLTRLRGDSRLTLTLEARHTDPVRQSDRDIVPDPQIPFDAIGNVIVNGQVLRVPETVADRSVPSAYGAGLRSFDLGPYRDLTANSDALKGEAVFATRIGKTLAGSFSLSAEQSRERTVGGPASAVLLVPASNPFSPFGAPMVLDRYLIEAPSLRERQTTTTLHAGLLLRGAIAGWRWDLTAAMDQKQVDGQSERGIDPAAANAAIVAGANPFVPLDAALLTDRETDVSRQRTRSAEMKAVATNNPIRLPAGKVTVTATIEAGRSTADSATRGANPFDLSLGRTRAEAGIALDVPLASKREGVLGFIGELSVNASVRARHVSGFGSLQDSTYGVSWAPIEAVQLMATIKRSDSAPDMTQQSSPAVQVLNVPVFDYGNGRTELVTLNLGGNPGLAAERRLTRSYGVTIKPFSKTELRISATYEVTRIRDQTGTVYATTPQTEAILPSLFVRDSSGRLTSVSYRPINFALERQRALILNLNASGKIGKAPPPPPPPAPGAKPTPPRGQPGYYGGVGPTIKFSDRLILRAGGPEFDLLRGDTVTGGGNPRAFGYAYAGVYYQGFGVNFDGWYGGGSRVRSADPAGDLRFSPILKLNLGGYLPVHRLLPHTDWTKKLQFRVDINNLTDARPRVRDGNGNVPNRFQRDYLDPIGRTVTISLRKLF